jgi:hypothetical protein
MSKLGCKDASRNPSKKAMRKHAQFLRVKKLKGAGIIKLAARHNLRELAFGKGGYNGIDARRTKQNYILRGANNAADVASYAQSLMDDAGIKSPRKDAVLGLEIVISLPLNSEIDIKPFFRDSLAWVHAYFQVPVVSAVVHLDESASHCHFIIVPIVNGHMNGSHLIGYKKKLHAMQADFNLKVGENYGLTYEAHGRRQEASKLNLACQKILEAIKTNPERLKEPALSNALMVAFNYNSDDLLLALANKKLNINSIGFDVLPTSQQEATSIGFANNLTAGDNQSISCVGDVASNILDEDRLPLRRKKLLNNTPTQKRLKRKPTTQIPQSWATVFGKSVKGA